MSNRCNVCSAPAAHLNPHVFYTWVSNRPTPGKQGITSSPSACDSTSNRQHKSICWLYRSFHWHAEWILPMNTNIWLRVGNGKRRARRRDSSIALVKLELLLLLVMMICRERCRWWAVFEMRKHYTTGRWRCPSMAASRQRMAACMNEWMNRGPPSEHWTYKHGFEWLSHLRNKKL